MLDINKLKKLNSKGFIVGPDETELQFFNRVEVLTGAKTKQNFGFKTTFLKRVFSQVYDFEVDWLLRFKKRSVNILYAAETNLFLIDGLIIPVVKLTENFFCKRYRKNILVHEVIHAIRAAFNEPKYEEFIAYSCSESVFYKNFGPIFCKRYDLFIFLLFSFLPLFGVFFTSCPFGLSFLPLFLFVIFLLNRLVNRRRTFKKALKRVEHQFDPAVNPLSIVVRLTDKEIEFFSKTNLSEARNFIDQQTSLRWRQILSSYKLKKL